MSSLIQKRPAWLKPRTESTQTPPTPERASPQKEASDVDFFNRTAGVKSYKEERERENRAKGERKRLRKQRKEEAKRNRKWTSPTPEDRDGGEAEVGQNADEAEDVPGTPMSSPEPVRFEDDGTSTVTPKKKRKISRENCQESPVKQSVEEGPYDLGSNNNVGASPPRKLASRHKTLRSEEPKVDAIVLDGDAEKGPAKNDDSTSYDKASNETDDQYYERLARQAEARHGREGLESRSRSDPRSPAFRSPTRHGPSTTQHLHPSRSARLTPNPKADEPILEILVHSRLPDTMPVVIRVRLNQKLRDAKAAWCEHSKLSADLTREVYLMWRGFKVFDTSTCRSIGVNIDAVTGEVTWRGKGLVEIAGSRQLEMEAWTAELEAQERKRKEGGKGEGREEVSADAEGEGKEPKKKVGLKVVVKAKELKEWSIIVHQVCLPAKYCWVVLTKSAGYDIQAAGGRVSQGAQDTLGEGGVYHVRRGPRGSRADDSGSGYRGRRDIRRGRQMTSRRQTRLRES